MFKLVVLSAIFAAAVAKPGALFTSLGYSAPLAYSPFLAPGLPATSTITQHAVQTQPLVYSSPLSFTHFIKKRSAPFTYFAPSSYIANTHLTAAPLATYSSPYAYSSPALVHGASILPAAPLPYVSTHLIKKRSAVFPATYAAGAPLLTSTYTPLVHSTPFVHSTPLVHSAPLISHPIVTPHFIKKRSAPLTYLAPTAYSHQSRVDYTHTSPLISTTYTAPITYSSPIAYTHVI